MTIEIILPATTEDKLSKGLRKLTKRIVKSTEEQNTYGILGGEFGYGEEFRNDTFEMHPFYWGDCTCGWDDMQVDFERHNPHEEHCFQAEAERRNPEDRYEEMEALATERGIPLQGCYSYCDCSYKALEDEFYSEHPSHESGCKIQEPNFLHYASGFEVRWYKYIGRGMEVNRELTEEQLTDILKECKHSLKK